MGEGVCVRERRGCRGWIASRHVCAPNTESIKEHVTSLLTVVLYSGKASSKSCNFFSKLILIQIHLAQAMWRF